MAAEVYLVREVYPNGADDISIHASVESAMMWICRFGGSAITLKSCNGLSTKFEEEGKTWYLESYKVHDVPELYGCPDDES